jgi:hypothetical protein
VRTAVVESFARRNPFLAVRVAPGDARVAMSLATLEFTIRNGRVKPESRAAAVRALDRSALADEPFLLTAVQAIADGHPALGLKLLEEARRRNPRTRMTRLLLLDRYIRAGRSEAAGAEVAAIRRLNPQLMGTLAPGLAAMARDPKTRAATARLLQRDPETRDVVLAQLAQSGADPDFVLSFAGAGAFARPAAWQEALVETLAARGNFGRAYKLWLAFNRISAPGDSKAVYDPDFAGLPGSPPFNWQLTPPGEGVAERSSGALQVDYYGRGPATLARQLLMLRPGAYRLEFRADGDAKGEGTVLSWNVACAPGNKPLLHLPLRDVDSAPKRFAASFSVPGSGCAAQWLSLDGTPGDVAAEQTARLSRLQIAQDGG